MREEKPRAAGNHLMGLFSFPQLNFSSGGGNYGGVPWDTPGAGVGGLDHVGYLPSDHVEYQPFGSCGIQAVLFSP